MKRRNRYSFIAGGLALLCLMSACAVHDEFPFICFRRACGGDVLGLKGFKKRVKGKVYAMKRQQNKRHPVKTKENSVLLPGQTKKDEQRSADLVKGNCVDYQNYLLLFSISQHPGRYDSLMVEYTGQHRSMTEVSQSRLSHLLDTIATERILKVYICDHRPVKGNAADELHRTRIRPVRRFLHRNGIPYSRITLLRDSPATEPAVTRIE